MDMGGYVFIAVLGPLTLAAMISTTIYMKVQANRLSAEIHKKGLVVYTFPILVTSGINDEHRPPLISPFTGLPPPPPYTRRPTVDPGFTAIDPRDPPPAYSESSGQIIPNTNHNQAYEMPEIHAVNELQRPTQRTD